MGTMILFRKDELFLICQIFKIAFCSLGPTEKFEMRKEPRHVG